MIRIWNGIGKRATALLLGVFLLGCAAAQTEHLVERSSGDIPIKVQLHQVPFHPQEAYYCGPASLAMLLNWSGVSATTKELAPQVFTPGRRGTLQTEMITAARRRGRIAYPVSNLKHLLQELAAGHPVGFLQNLGLAWYPKWHFAVAIGYDLKRREILLHSGLEPEKRLPLDLFERTWARGDFWAVVVLPPDRLPATAQEGRYLRAALGLERVKRFGDAVRAYESALQRWPKSYPAWMGLGNSRYEKGDLTGAEKAFRSAIRVNPKAGSAYNNLAHVLAERGRRQEALAAARKAVASTEQLRPVFRETLRCIETGAQGENCPKF